MFAWQWACSLTMLDGDREFQKTKFPNSGREIRRHGSGAGKSADAEFRRHFPWPRITKISVSKEDKILNFFRDSSGSFVAHQSSV